jgi:3D-(3,5/4)-trihydroxycyclohexane-1,2-dione acylhydrolase (decyclizing)
LLPGIGGLSRARRSEGFGTECRCRRGERLDGRVIPVDSVLNAASLEAYRGRARTREDLAGALAEARKQNRTSVVVVETDINRRVPGYESWWDLAIVEGSGVEPVRTARREYILARLKESYFFCSGITAR